MLGKKGRSRNQEKRELRNILVQAEQEEHEAFQDEMSRFNEEIFGPAWEDDYDDLDYDFRVEGINRRLAYASAAPTRRLSFEEIERR